MHGDLAGFSAREVELIANVARYHRRALPKKAHENFARLDKEDRRLVRRLAGILRVADGLDRTHARLVTGVACRVSGAAARIEVQAAQNPKVELWDAQRKARLFEQAFGAALELEWVKQRRAPAAESARREGTLTVVAGGKA